MAATPTPRRNLPDLPGNPAAAALAGLQLPLPLAVAYSGGADSTVLLLAAVQRWPGQVQAIHVHHGLQDAADAFAEHCRQVCAQLAIPLQVRRVHARNLPGESPEDAARQAIEAAGKKVHLIGGADVAAELDAKRAIDQGSRLAAEI